MFQNKNNYFKLIIKRLKGFEPTNQESFLKQCKCSGTLNARYKKFQVNELYVGRKSTNMIKIFYLKMNQSCKWPILIMSSSRGARGEKSPDINFLHNARPEETVIPDTLKQYFTLVSRLST